MKLREVSLSYTLPPALFRDFFLAGIRVALVARDLWILHKKVPYLDPEFSTSYDHQSGIEMGLYPSVRTLGIDLKVDF